MLQILYFLLFIIYIYIVFAFKNFFNIFLCIIFNLILIFILRISIKKAILNLISLMPFIILTSILNLILGNLTEMILISLKLIIVCNITFIYKSALGTINIIQTIEKIFSPLKYIGISSSDISIIINISFISIPTFLKEIKVINHSLLSKGVKNFSISNIKYTAKLILISIFKKTNELEFALKSKGFLEE